jgi:hypothetical protein
MDSLSFVWPTTNHRAAMFLLLVGIHLKQHEHHYLLVFIPLLVDESSNKIMPTHTHPPNLNSNSSTKSHTNWNNQEKNVRKVIWRAFHQTLCGGIVDTDHRRSMEQHKGGRGCNYRLPSKHLYNIVQQKHVLVPNTMAHTPLNIYFRHTLTRDKWTSWLHLIHWMMNVTLNKEVGETCINWHVPPHWL